MIVRAIRRDAKRQSQVGHRQVIAGLLGPLDHDDRPSVEGFLETRISPRARVGESIKIKMMEIKPREIIRFDQRECGAGNAPLVAKRAKQFAHQRGLARAQITGQIEPKARSQTRCKRPREATGGLQPFEDALGPGAACRLERSRTIGRAGFLGRG